MAKRPTFSGMDLTNVFTQGSEKVEEQTLEKSELHPPASRIQVNRQSTYSIQISAVRPDRYQARHVLPRQLRDRFWRQMDWREVAGKWIQLARKDKLIRNDLDELMQLGRSLDQDGQIKPITGNLRKTRAGSRFLKY